MKGGENERETDEIFLNKGIFRVNIWIRDYF